MNIMINCSNLKIGGAMQVSHSFINEIKDNLNHNFFIVLSNELYKKIDIDDFPPNFHFMEYSFKVNLLNIFFGYDKFLSAKEIQFDIDCVFTVFGPSYWKPKSKHLCGFARPQYIYTDSPFFIQITFLEKLKLLFQKIIHLRDFRIKTDVLVTENEDVSKKLSNQLPTKLIKTVTNCHNQVFDNKDSCLNNLKINKEENEIVLITITSYYRHKNLEIIPKVIDEMLIIDPNIKVNFVLTIKEGQLNVKIDKKIKKYMTFLGSVDINECPNLYNQSDFLFLPTLLECFSASYPEAMISKTPIITSDLGFAKGICNDAAIYINPLDPKHIAKKITGIITNQNQRKKLIESGLERLKYFDNSKSRAKKYISILENFKD